MPEWMPLSPEQLATISMVGTILNAAVAMFAIRRHCNDDKEREVRERVRSELNTERIVVLERRMNRGEQR
jgi:hypothetical protein